MVGRIYDPTLGRFLQADPFVQAPNNTQNYNRYSYVLNNPMSYTDPSGYFFKKLLKELANVPVLNTVVQIGVGIACGAAAAQCMAAFSAMQTYAVTGSLSAGLKAGIISYATSSAFKEIGGNFTKDLNGSNFFSAGVKNGARHILSHAMVGGVSSVLSGGKFGHGFLSAGATKGLTPHFEGFGGSDFEMNGYNVAEAVIAGMLGGTISKLSGGKFANGAISAALGNLFNNQESRKRIQAQRERLRALKEHITRLLGEDYNDETGSHFYKVRTTCNGCSEGDLSLVLESLLKNPAPSLRTMFGLDARGTALEGIQEGFAFPVGFVQHVVNVDSLSVVNMTGEMHLLSPGTVIRSVVWEQGALHIDTTGYGTGILGQQNNDLAVGLWGNLDNVLLNNMRN